MISRFLAEILTRALVADWDATQAAYLKVCVEVYGETPDGKP